jgi:hypothetical protein
VNETRRKDTIETGFDQASEPVDTQIVAGEHVHHELEVKYAAGEPWVSIAYVGPDDPEIVSGVVEDGDFQGRAVCQARMVRVVETTVRRKFLVVQALKVAISSPDEGSPAPTS